MSDAVQRWLLELSDEAIARGDGEAFSAAVKRFVYLLAVYPQFGEPKIDLQAESGAIYLASVPPLVMRYAVYEDRRLVMIGAPPRLLRRSKSDSDAEQ